MPAAHDGETEFWLEFSFDTPVVQGSKAPLRELLGVTGGSETRFRRNDSRLDHWQIRIDPSSQNAVTVMLSPSPPCGDSGAVCTNDGRTFTTGLGTQIHGPASGDSNRSEEGNRPDRRLVRQFHHLHHPARAGPYPWRRIGGGRFPM